MQTYYLLKQHTTLVIKCLTSCMPGDLACYLSSANFNQNSTLKKNSFKNTIRASNCLDADQAPHFVLLDSGLKCLYMFSVDDSGKELIILSHIQI